MPIPKSMQEATSPRVSLRQIAARAGVSKAAVTYALQNGPGIGQATRERIIRVAQELGYVPDARLAGLMAAVRQTREKVTLPIAWLNAESVEDAWQVYKFLSPILEGATQRSADLGFRLEQIWIKQPGMTMKRLSGILYQRGIEGVIVTDPARHIRLAWESLAAIAVGGALLVPALDHVTADMNFNLLLAWKSLKRLGYKRIGICLTEQVDSFSHHVIRSTAIYLCGRSPVRERVRPLFHSYRTVETEKGKQLARWMQSQQPDVVIGHDHRLVQWAEEAGFRVPEDCGVVHLAVEDDASTWAGIHANKREMGQAAVERLVALMCARRFGIPKVPQTVLIRGKWQMGGTVVSQESGSGAARLATAQSALNDKYLDH